MIKTGTIVKGIAGFYYVDTGDKIYECKARGIFKNEKLKPAVGDETDIDIAPGDEDTGVIVGIRERRNYFLRPPVANIEQFVVVSALADPKPNIEVIDRFLAAAEMNDVDTLLCFTKTDLVSDDEISFIKDVYRNCYPAVFLNLTEDDGIDDLIPYLKGRRSALAGPSGVGKSTILNLLKKNRHHDTEVETGSVSEKTKRGRHTTRHVELFKMNFGGAVFDTPGFTSFDPPEVPEDELDELFPDIARFRGNCRFSGCRHLSEPGCAVREAVEKGDIHEQRYMSYCSQLKQLRDREKRKYQ